MDKQTLRREIGARKRAMTPAEIDARSRVLAERLYATEAYQLVRSLYAYLAFNQEVRTRPVIERAWADGKRVAVPKIMDGEMRFIWIDGFDGLAENRFGILEPVSDAPVADDEAALVLVPGLAFDARGYRVGYGGGYYDRWLAAHPLCPAVALCFGFQRVDKIEHEAHDVPVGLVIGDA